MADFILPSTGQVPVAAIVNVVSLVLVRIAYWVIAPSLLGQDSALW